MFSLDQILELVQPRRPLAGPGHKIAALQLRLLAQHKPKLVLWCGADQCSDERAHGRARDDAWKQVLVVERLGKILFYFILLLFCVKFTVVCAVVKTIFIS